jgi:polar amino acid transport system substrate-binding protein
MKRIPAIMLVSILSVSCASTPQSPPAVRAELAPTGILRTGIYFQNVFLARKDPATGKASGIAVDLAAELGRRLGVPVSIVAYETPGEMANAVKAGAWDVAFLATDPGRTGDIAFTAPYVEIEATFLVPVASSLHTIADVDNDGVRIAVGAKSANDLYLSRTFKRARLERAPSAAAAFKLFVTDKLEALADIRPRLAILAQELPGSRILDGRFSVVQQSIGVPVGRDAGAKYLREFVEDAKATGLIAQTIKNNGVHGLAIAPMASAQ